MNTIWLLAIFLLPIVLIILLKANAVYVYLCLCLGYVLSQFDGSSEAVSKLSTVRIIIKYGASADVRLILLLLPALIALLFTIKTSHKAKFSVYNIAAIAVGVLAVILVTPLLPVNEAVNIMTSSSWRDVIKYRSILLSLSSLVVLVMLALERSKGLSPKHQKKHHKAKE